MEKLENLDIERARAKDNHVCEVASGYLFKQLSNMERHEVLEREHAIVGEIQSKINRIQDQLSK